jgi:hypothetical protein
MEASTSKKLTIPNYSNIGLTIRKISKEGNRIKYLSEKNIDKQMLTLLKKIQKFDKSAFCRYSIEPSNHAMGNHIHMILSLSDIKHLNAVMSRLLKYVDAHYWYVENNVWYDIKKCEGRFGSIHMFPIYDDIRFDGYINKTSLSKTLI